MNTKASPETYCPDHPGHIMTRSGYCIHGQHRPENLGEPVARGMWLVENESSEPPEGEVETDMSKTAELPITDRQWYEDIDFANEPDLDEESPAEVQQGESPEEPEEGEGVAGILDEATGESHDFAATVLAEVKQTVNPIVEIESYAMETTYTQLTLSDDLVARYELDTTAFSVSGTVKFLDDEWGGIAEGLEPMDKVAVTLLGYVKRIGTDGKALQVAIAMETVQALQVMRDE